MKKKWILLFGIVGAALGAAALMVPSVRGRVRRAVTGGRTVAQVIETVGPRVRPKLRAAFRGAGCRYPPRELSLVAIKDERRLEVWTTDRAQRWRRVSEYPILGASGGPGPKLREGDGQVPEGVYRITALNPNSAFHLSMRVDYPNAFDRRMAAAEGRANLGGDIFIHGGRASIGCLAMGDPAIEELFVLVHDAGLPRSRITIAPSAHPRPGPELPSWTPQLYARIREDLGRRSTPAPPAPPHPQ